MTARGDGLAGDLERTVTELRDALREAKTRRDTAEAREAALAEVLAVINRSPGDPGPVFHTILQKAHSLCAATIGSLQIYDGTYLRVVAAHGYPPDHFANTGLPFRPTAANTQRLIDGERLIHYADVAAMPAESVGDFRNVVEMGVRTILLIPLRKNGTYLGGISALRTEVKRFTDAEISLLESFAAQAVIAMENARLITEQREALEQQTATADVLQVINASPGDLKPVFDAMLEKAMRLCGATIGGIYRYDGQRFDTVTLRGVTPGFAAFSAENPMSTIPGGPPSVVLETKRPVQVEDIAATDRYRDGTSVYGRALVDIGGIRAVLNVPLLKDDAVLGLITIYRAEPGAFSDKQIALLENFAAQAVIAMENARLITETREALDQQTATAEVLQVINSSPGNLTPVFDAIAAAAAPLCDAANCAVFRFDGSLIHLSAQCGLTAGQLDTLRNTFPLPPGRGSITARAVMTRQVVHVPDSAADVEFAHPSLIEAGLRGGASVPMLREGVAIGAITVTRQESRSFSDKQIALLENFAAQAVIAMENARLLTETREALEQQTATAEVLQVINSSPGDLTPVFDAMLEKALRLCDAAFGNLWTYDGEVGRLAAICGASPEYRAELMRAGPQKPDPGISLKRLVEGEPLLHIADITAEGAHRSGAALRRMLADRAGARTVLWVPMHKDGALLGFFTIYRTEVRPFTNKQIALLQNFAEQAVIAMENVRLLTEQREALERQTATAEVLQAINGNPGDLTPVFDAILEKAHNLIGAAIGALVLYEGPQFRAVATHGFSEQHNAMVRQLHGPTPGHMDLVAGARFKHYHDLRSIENDQHDVVTRSHVENNNARTALWVPLRKDDRLLGLISVYRLEVRPFVEKEIALLENFAAHAVIAMENARLITEQREALEQQTATAEVLQVINSSPGDLKPVFDAILRKAHILCGAEYGVLLTYDGEVFWPAAVHGDRLANSETFRRGLRPGFGFTKLIRGERLLHIHDMAKLAAEMPDDPVPRAQFEISGIRTQLAVPLRRDDKLLGIITANRREVRPFVDKEIALLENFAAQAVIAMENARLLNEQREALEQQTATAEVLQVINASQRSLAPVFEAILEKAHSLCGATKGAFVTFNGELFQVAATRGLSDTYARFLQNAYPEVKAGYADDELSLSPREQLLNGVDLVHLTGPAVAIGPIGRAVAELENIRTLLFVPLRRDGALLGYITAYREEEVPFSDKQIALLQNFAAQAVIAMETARLLNEIRQRQEELRITFENMGDGVALFDETRHLVASNRRFQDMLDVPDRVISARPAFADYIRYLADRGEYGPGAEAHVQRLLEFGSQSAAFERTRPNGRIIEIRVNPVPNGGFVVIYSDITERKRNEEELRAARDAAEEASRTIEAAYRDLKTAQASLIQAEKMASLGQLTAGIAHEIKNPLNFVNNFAELSGDLLDELNDAVAANRQAEIDELRATLQGNLAKITEHGRRADAIVRSMLEHSRGSSAERRMVDLNALIDEALNLGYHGARAQDQSFNITLERDFDAGIAPIEVNPQDMTRVFLNIFSNGFYAATRRARNGADDIGFVPTLKVTTRDAGEAVEVRVRDNGTGIPAEIRDKLFQPFFTTKPTGEGTGLGLSITYDIVTKAHGGSIAVDSKVGDYSEFTIRLPRNL